MTSQPDYKTLSDGSIDYRHYLDRSARLRSKEFSTAFRALWRLLFGPRADGRRARTAIEPVRPQRAARISARSTAAPVGTGRDRRRKAQG